MAKNFHGREKRLVSLLQLLQYVYGKTKDGSVLSETVFNVIEKGKRVRLSKIYHVSSDYNSVNSLISLGLLEYKRGGFIKWIGSEPTENTALLLDDYKNDKTVVKTRKKPVGLAEILESITSPLLDETVEFTGYGKTLDSSKVIISNIYRNCKDAPQPISKLFKHLKIDENTRLMVEADIRDLFTPHNSIVVIIRMAAFGFLEVSFVNKTKHYQWKGEAPTEENVKRYCVYSNSIINKPKVKKPEFIVESPDFTATEISDAITLNTPFNTLDEKAFVFDGTKWGELFLHMLAKVNEISTQVNDISAKVNDMNDEHLERKEKKYDEQNAENILQAKLFVQKLTQI